MVFIIHLLAGLISSFAGSITPSMLNMTALKISLEKSKKEAVWFSTGVSVVVFLQAYIAVVFAKYILENPMIIRSIEKVAFVLFILLSIYFYKQYKKQKIKKVTTSSKEKSNFLIGVFLSVLNMFAIPFYCAIVTTFEMLGWVDFYQSTNFSFVVGSALGTFGILIVYVKYSANIQQKTGKLTKDINLILSFLTGIVAVITLLKFFIV